MTIFLKSGMRVVKIVHAKSKLQAKLICWVWKYFPDSYNSRNYSIIK